jgi:hypothetical protein
MGSTGWGKRMQRATWRTRPVHTALAVVAAAYRVPQSRLRCGREYRSGRPYGVTNAEAEMRHLVRWLAVRLGASSLHVGYYLGCDGASVRNSRAVVDARRASDAAFASRVALLVESAAKMRSSHRPAAGCVSPGVAVTAQPAE